MNSQLKNYFQKYRLIRHFLFWLAYLTISTIAYGTWEGIYYLSFVSHLFYMPVVMAATYFTMYLLIPKYLLTKKYIQFILLFCLSALLFSALQRLNIYLIVIPKFYPQLMDKFEFFTFDIFFRILKIYPVVIIASSIKILLTWYQDQQLNQQLVKEKLEAELKF